MSTAVTFKCNIAIIFRIMLSALMPNCFKQKIRNESPKPVRNSPTSYLNGFRGIVAFFVFLRHFSLPWQPDLDYGFGQGEGHLGIFRLPGLRLLYAGPNVPVFLVVSGLVMSIKPLRFLEMGQEINFLNSMVSSIFRRAIRIFPAPVMSSFAFMLAVHFQLFTPQYDTMKNFIPHHPNPLPSFSEQLKDWFRFVVDELTCPWSWKIPHSAYGGHLWTIGLQFRSSLVLFLVLMGLASTRKNARQAIIAALFTYCMFSGRWDVALYLSGMFMAGTVRVQQMYRSPVTSLNETDLVKTFEPGLSSSIYSSIYWYCTLLTGLYLASYPRVRDGTGAPGYTLLYSINAYYMYWQGCGAIILVWRLLSCRSAQRVFNSSFPQYLGKISFSLYIVHEPLLHILGYGIVNFAWGLVGKETVFQYQLGFFFGLFMTSLILLWTAEIFHKLVDEPLACLGKRLETSCK